MSIVLRFCWFLLMPCTTHFLSWRRRAEFLFPTIEQRRMNVFVFQRTFSGETRHVIISSIFTVVSLSLSLTAESSDCKSSRMTASQQLEREWDGNEWHRLNKLVIRIQSRVDISLWLPTDEQDADPVTHTHTRIDYIRWMGRIRNQQRRKRRRTTRLSSNMICFLLFLSSGVAHVFSCSEHLRS